MFRIIGIVTFLCVLAWAKEKDSFITEREYAEHLYKNPRGIGCHKCHGEKGEGMLISSYAHKGEKKQLKTFDMTALSYDEFHKALEANKGMMPKYFLTEKEIKALYRYLHDERKKEKKEK